jgi:hypothetical protein
MTETADYDPQVKAIVDDVMSALPGVRLSKAFGYPAYKINGRVFAFVGGRGMAIKLPVNRVQALIGQGAPFAPFEVAQGIIWREWVSLEYDDASAYPQHEDLFTESLAYVASRA